MIVNHGSTIENFNTGLQSFKRQQNEGNVFERHIAKTQNKTASARRSPPPRGGRGAIATERKREKEREIKGKGRGRRLVGEEGKKKGTRLRPHGDKMKCYRHPLLEGPRMAPSRIAAHSKGRRENGQKNSRGTAASVNKTLYRAWSITQEQDEKNEREEGRSNWERKRNYSRLVE